VLLLAVLYASGNKAKYFDPTNTLHESALTSSFDERVLAAILSAYPKLSNTVVHFQNDSCFCQVVADRHIGSVKTLAAKNQFQNVQLNVETVTALKAILPSVPAVAVIDKQGNLSYLGPYSSGIFCSQGNGLVEPFIKDNSAVRYGATVISQSQGCYCALST
jgi:hypothetical protein